MKNQKGFSIIELVVSFSVCLVISAILFQIVISLKELYEKSGVKTELLHKQNLIVDQIYTDVLDKGLDSITACGSYCANFKFSDSTEKMLQYSSQQLSYGDYVTTLIQGSVVEEISISIENNVAFINLPIKHRLFPKDKFNIRIIHILN